MKKKSIFERGIAIMLSVVMLAACFPLSTFAEEATSFGSPQFSSDAANALMKDTKPTGFDKTTNPYQSLRLRR